MTVLNRPGAAQTIAINYLAQKKGDGNGNREQGKADLLVAQSGNEFGE